VGAGKLFFFLLPSRTRPTLPLSPFLPGSGSSFFYSLHPQCPGSSSSPEIGRRRVFFPLPHIVSAAAGRHPFIRAFPYHGFWSFFFPGQSPGLRHPNVLFSFSTAGPWVPPSPLRTTSAGLSGPTVSVEPLLPLPADTDDRSPFSGCLRLRVRNDFPFLKSLYRRGMLLRRTDPAPRFVARVFGQNIRVFFWAG